MIFWIFEQHAPATAMPSITSALQFPISNHASGTHSSPLLGDRHAPGGLLRLQHLRDNRCKQTTRREMPKHAFAQAPLTCTTALFLRTPAPRDSARTPTFRNSAHTNSEAIGHRTQSNTEITSLHCERSNKTEWHLSPRGDLGILYYFIIHAILCSLLRISDQRPRISKRLLEIHINSKD